MKTVDVNKEYKVYYISKGNKIWTSLLERLEGDEPVLFDFRNVRIQEPWGDYEFRRFILDNRVYMKVYTAQEIKNTIEAMVRLSDSKPGRVINEDIVVKSVMTPRDIEVKKLEARINNVMNVEKDGKTIRFKMNKLFSQIGDYMTIDALKMAIKHYTEDHPEINEAIIDFGNAHIYQDVFHKLAEIDVELGVKGLKIELESEDDKSLGYISIERCIKDSKNMTDIEKMDRFNNLFKPGDVGILTVFKESKKLDFSGRMSDAEALYRRPAIFDGFERAAGSISLQFRSFPGKYFYTQNHYYLDNDGEILKDIPTTKHRYDISEIGLENVYVGARGHFNSPIQYEPDEYHSTYRSNTNVEIKLTVPEYIKTVLDDHKIKYNYSRLANDIVITERYLRSLKAK